MWEAPSGSFFLLRCLIGHIPADLNTASSVEESCPTELRDHILLSLSVLGDTELPVGLDHELDKIPCPRICLSRPRAAFGDHLNDDVADLQAAFSGAAFLRTNYIPFIRWPQRFNLARSCVVNQFCQILDAVD